MSQARQSLHYVPPTNYWNYIANDTTKYFQDKKRKYIYLITIPGECRLQNAKSAEAFETDSHMV